MGAEHQRFSMGRFGWKKKNKPVPTITDVKLPLPRSSDAPRVPLSYVETQLNMHQYNGLFEVTPERQNGSVESPTGKTPFDPWYQSLGDWNADYLSLYIAQHPSNPTNGDVPSTEWSSAVGHAATGKSGRVIHNLQEDIARLTRECSLHRSRAEETQRINDAFKTQVENMAERLRNLELANERNLQSIARKDRKIEELRSESQSERNRRQRAEGETNKINQIMAETQDEFNRKSAELQETTNHARTQYDVLATTRQREQAEQQRKLQGIRSEFIALQRENGKRNAQLEQLDTVIAQKNREIETGRERLEKVIDSYEAYKEARDLEIRELIDKGHQNQASIDTTLESLKKTEGEMKWAIRVKDEVPGAQ